MLNATAMIERDTRYAPKDPTRYSVLQDLALTQAAPNTYWGHIRVHHRAIFSTSTLECRPRSLWDFPLFWVLVLSVN